MGEHCRVTISAFLALSIFESTISDPTRQQPFSNRSLDARRGSFGFAFDFSVYVDGHNVTDVGRDYNKVTSWAERVPGK